MKTLFSSHNSTKFNLVLVFLLSLFVAICVYHVSSSFGEDAVRGDSMHRVGSDRGVPANSGVGSRSAGGGQSQPSLFNSDLPSAVRVPSPEECRSLTPSGDFPKGCPPGIPSPEVAAQDGAADEKTLLAKYTAQKVIDVLKVQPGSAEIAFKSHATCGKDAGTSEARHKECAELKSILPYILTILAVDFKRGHDEAALLLAEHDFKRLQGAIAVPAVWPEYLQSFDQYLQFARSKFPAESEKLNSKVAPFRR